MYKTLKSACRKSNIPKTLKTNFNYKTITFSHKFAARFDQ